jgi:alkylation response protein AidB-like acyl-CoA dehydrogenase
MIAEALLETVAARAPDTEQQRRLPADLAAELAQAGLFRMLVPKSLGGAEVDVATLFGALEQLGRADAATGWFSGQMGDADVVQDIAERYARLITLWDAARATQPAEATAASV